MAKRILLLRISRFMELVLATTNPGKILEIQEALADLSLKLISLEDVRGRLHVALPLEGALPAPIIIEDQESFKNNALKKARVIAAWSGKPTLADDSGLVVEALGGRPGVHSARYAGAQATDANNRKKLLEEMASVPAGRRQATFVCVLALVLPGEKEIVVEGKCEGQIIFKERGALGFGYDPLFEIPSLGKTTAELSLKEKNQISHRGQALQRLCEILKK